MPRRPDLSPEQIALVAAWIAHEESGTPTPFRNRVKCLMKSIGLPAAHVYSVLRRQRPDLWNGLNRLREAWYARRDAAIRFRRDKMTRAELASTLGLSVEGLRRTTQRACKARTSSRWGAPPENAFDDAMERFEEALSALEAECWPPVQPFPAMRAFAEATALEVDAARRAVEYYRADLFARYRALRSRYDQAFHAAVREGAPTADLADWFDVDESAVRKRKTKNLLTKLKNRSILPEMGDK